MRFFILIFLDCILGRFQKLLKPLVYLRQASPGGSVASWVEVNMLDPPVGSSYVQRRPCCCYPPDIASSVVGKMQYFFALCD